MKTHNNKTSSRERPTTLFLCLLERFTLSPTQMGIVVVVWSLLVAANAHTAANVQAPTGSTSTDITRGMPHALLAAELEPELEPGRGGASALHGTLRAQELFPEHPYVTDQAAKVPALWRLRALLLVACAYLFRIYRIVGSWDSTSRCLQVAAYAGRVVAAKKRTCALSQCTVPRLLMIILRRPPVSAAAATPAAVGTVPALPCLLFLGVAA